MVQYILTRMNKSSTKKPSLLKRVWKKVSSFVRDTSPARTSTENTTTPPCPPESSDDANPNRIQHVPTTPDGKLKDAYKAGNSKAEKWHEALNTMQTSHKTEFDNLDKNFNKLGERQVEKIDAMLYDGPTKAHSDSHSDSRQFLHRMKYRSQQLLPPLKAFIMPLANLDTHRIAPIGCALLFSILEGSFALGG
jgi:hypothetical protein